MLRILLPCCAALAASTPLPQEAAMRSPTPASGSAAQGPTPDPVSAAENPVPDSMATDSPEEARGRRTLSTAFVRVGPDGHLTVELRNGSVLVLRDVVMHPRKYCGRVPGPRSTSYCGRYADVGAARPGGAPASDEPEPAVANPIEPKSSAPHHR